MKELTLELKREQEIVEKMARSYGLDFFTTIFEMVTYDQMSEFAAQGGFPVRYPHWRFGMEYEKLSKSYEYGLSKIYEMVINTNPAYAYLMEGNMHVDQKLVMAHVYGHVDFFKNNKWFEPTDRKMLDNMANCATRIRRYIDRLGYDPVEEFIDKCLSLENLIDRHSVYFKKEKSSKDILLFLIQNAQLESWQQDILGIIRDEAYYFAPQGMTKIMNEGWASYWHTTMMTHGLLKDSEIVDYADHHSGAVAMAPTGFNPYKIGLELFRDIEDRWNKGHFGRDWEQCDDMDLKKNWDKKLGLGRQKMFEVRRDYNDVMFIDEFLTEEFCIRNKMFVYKFNQRTGEYVVDTRDFKEIKKKLLFQLTNMGQPIIELVDGNYEGRKELLLKHLFEGVDMQPDYMKETMKNLQAVWQRPIHMMTVMDGQEKIFRFDGQEFKETLVKDAGQKPA